MYIGVFDVCVAFMKSFVRFMGAVSELCAFYVRVMVVRYAWCVRAFVVCETRTQHFTHIPNIAPEHTGGVYTSSSKLQAHYFTYSEN